MALLKMFTPIHYHLKVGVNWKIMEFIDFISNHFQNVMSHLKIYCLWNVWKQVVNVDWQRSCLDYQQMGKFFLLSLIFLHYIFLFNFFNLFHVTNFNRKKKDKHYIKQWLRKKYIKNYKEIETNNTKKIIQQEIKYSISYNKYVEQVKIYFLF